MLFSLLVLFFSLLGQSVLAGPIQRNPGVVRRANAPAKRFIALSDPISFHVIHARATGATGVSISTSGATPPASTSTGKEDGKVPAVGVGAGNTSLLALLNSTISTAPPGTSQRGSATSSSIIATSQANSVGQAAVATASISNSLPSNITATSPIGSQAQATTSSSSSTGSKQVGKVPAVGVGFGNTSLLALLSSTIDASTQSSPSVTVSEAPSAQTAAENVGSAPSSSTSESCTDIVSSTVNTGTEPVLAAQTTGSSGTIGSAATPKSPAETSSTVDAPISAPRSPTTSSATNINSPIPTILTSTATDPELATTVVPVSSAGSPEQSVDSIAVPATVSPSIPAGSTVTLQISTIATTTVPFSEPLLASETPLAASDGSAVSPSSENEETVTVLVSTTLVTTVSGTPGVAPVSESTSSEPSTGLLASTTVTPLANPSSLVTLITSATPTPTPPVSIQKPGASLEATPSVPAPAPAGGSPDVTIPLGPFSIVIESAPIPTAAGNTVIPVMGSFLTVTVTTTVTAR